MTTKKREVYENDDLILPMIKFKKSAKITIEITDKEVSLQIGPRDWQWDRKTGQLLGCGTMLS